MFPIDFPFDLIRKSKGNGPGAGPGLVQDFSRASPVRLQGFSRTSAVSLQGFPRVQGLSRACPGLVVAAQKQT